MAYYVAMSLDGRDYFGRPAPAAGVRVVFDPDLMFAAREHRLGRPVARRLNGDEGLVVHEDPRDVLDWPCRLWEVADPDGEARLPGNSWFRSRAVTVVREVPGWLVFGERGAGVATVIEQARALTDAQVRVIAGSAGPPSPGELSQLPVGDGVVHPIGNALLTVHAAVNQAAWATSADLFAFDAEDGTHYIADEAWKRASSVALAAAAVAGTDAGPELTALARHWSHVTARPN